mgnify:CR=1 FL=1
MRMKKFYLPIAIAILCLCSCSSVDSIVGNGSSMVEDSSGSNNEEKDMPLFHLAGLSRTLSLWCRCQP